LSRLKIGKHCNDFNGYIYLAAVVAADEPLSENLIKLIETTEFLAVSSIS
jgi:hypothetical protein